MAATFKSPLATFRATHSPATATQATISVSAQAAVNPPTSPNFQPYMVVQGFSVSLGAGATAQTPVKWNLIDGTSGGTNVQIGGVAGAPANQAFNVTQTDLMIPITSGTATLEFSAAGVTASQEVVSIWGYHANYGDV